MVTLVLFIALLATAMGQSVVMAILPSLGREAGLSELQVATILSSSALIFAVGTTRWSSYAARAGNRRTLLYGLGGYTLGTFCFATVFWLGLQQSLTGYGLFACLLAARMAQSTIMSATPPAALGYIMGYARARDLHLVASLSRVTSANNLGQVLGPGLAGLLVVFGLVAPLYAIIVLTCLALLLVWFKLPEETAAPQATDSADSPTAPGLILPALPLMMFAVVIFICLAMLQQTLGFIFIDHFGLTPVEAAQASGTAMMCCALAALTVQWTVVQKRWLALLPALITAAILMTLGYALITIATALYAVYAGMVAIGGGLGIGYPSVTASATQHCKRALRARITGLMTATPAIGYVIGPPAAAMLYQVDFHLPLITCAVLSSLLFIVPAQLSQHLPAPK
ncbi:MFS transporter [Alteromonas gilva]|uniref:MFS transporter n=1 Tax=Alteromonas gilva TaxID=2987522 RepID=A0ABT5L2Z5_9ALTE|nr:MFS transporter [Alteromonas gilva]MDC8830153.1 MFS transporter [Alteromonas gilva]